jgi:hypothetical protein
VHVAEALAHRRTNALGGAPPPAKAAVMRLSVADTGPGVAPEARQRIFEAFVQTDIGHATQLGGAGLGLAIVSTLAKAMDGEVGVGGELGQGAEFWFEAPLTSPLPPSAAAPLAGRTVAIASPNAVVRAAAVRQIEAAGGRAFAAVDIASALSPPRPTPCC